MHFSCYLGECIFQLIQVECIFSAGLGTRRARLNRCIISHSSWSRNNDFWVSAVAVDFFTFFVRPETWRLREQSAMHAIFNLRKSIRTTKILTRCIYNSIFNRLNFFHVLRFLSFSRSAWRWPYQPCEAYCQSPHNEKPLLNQLMVIFRNGQKINRV